MDRFHDGDTADERPEAFLVVTEFGVEAQLVDGEKRYVLVLRDQNAGDVTVMLGSAGVAQLVHSLAKAAVAACDEEWLTMMMVLITESRESSLDRLFESGHAKGNLPD